MKVSSFRPSGVLIDYWVAALQVDVGAQYFVTENQNQHIDLGAQPSRQRWHHTGAQNVVPLLSTNYNTKTRQH